jgi:signal transduction histidine kinase
MNYKKIVLPIYRFRRWFSRQIYHFVFLFSLLMLTMLVTWWAIFLNRSVEQAYELKYDAVLRSVDLNAFTLGHNKHNFPEPGLVGAEGRMEIVNNSGDSGRYSVELLPYWQGYFIRPTEEYILEIRDELRRQHLMIIGESGLLVVLILVSGFMIYRMYWLEKRTTRELHELWSRVSHDIKTPITGLRAFLETLRDEEMSREEMTPLIRMALKQVERQQLLAENMLVGQKLKNQGIGFHLHTIELMEFLQNYFENHSIHLSQNRVSFSINSDEPLEVQGDGEAIRIICDNITDNAIKYAGNTLELDVEIKTQGSRAIVSFTDNGPGIEPGTEEDIFKAYRRLDKESPGGSRGTGMGLHISRHLAREMGGELLACAATAESKKGAQFILYLNKTFREDNIDKPRQQEMQ